MSRYSFVICVYLCSFDFKDVIKYTSTLSFFQTSMKATFCRVRHPSHPGWGHLSVICHSMSMIWWAEVSRFHQRHDRIAQKREGRQGNCLGRHFNVSSDDQGNHLTTFTLLCFSLQGRHNEHHSISNHRYLDCLLNRLFRRTSTKPSKLRVTALCGEKNPPVTHGFHSQRASNSENVYGRWHHHAMNLKSWEPWYQQSLCWWYLSRFVVTIRI